MLSTRDLARLAIREQIALTAMQRFARDGFAATTVEDIAGDLAMSPRTFFRYFRSKDDIVLASLDTFHTGFLSAFDAALGDADLWGALGVALGGALREETQHQAIVRDTPALLGRQLEALERLQAAVADAYRARGGTVAPLGPVTTQAVVRCAFACWSAVRHDPAASAETRAASLRRLMEGFRPAILRG